MSVSYKNISATPFEYDLTTLIITLKPIQFLTWLYDTVILPPGALHVAFLNNIRR